MKDFGSFIYSIGQAGFNYNKNQTGINSNHMIEDSYNFNLWPNYIEVRGGTDVVMTLPERSPVTSISPTIIEDDTHIILSTTNSGNIYKDTTLLKQLPSQISSASYLEWNNNIIISSPNNIPQVWLKGQTYTSDFPSDKMSPDWVANSSYPSIIITYGKSNSLRAWAIGVSTNETTLYYSKPFSITDTVPDFSVGTQNESGLFVISTPNDEPLVGLIDFGDRLFVFSNSQTFIIEDTPISPTEWSYASAQWRGGTISQSTLVKSENDLFSLMADGTCYSVTAVREYGDYKIASLSEPNSIDEYIREQVYPGTLENIHICFDPNIRAIKIFCAVSQDSTLTTYIHQNNQAIVYFIDRGLQSGWSIHKNEEYQSGYDAASSRTYKIEDEYLTLTGDYYGRIWKLETDKILDDDEFFGMKIITPFLAMDNKRSTKRFQNGFIEVTNHSPIFMKIRLLTDDYSKEKFIEKEIKAPYVPRYNIDRWNECYYPQDTSITTIHYGIHRLGIYLQQEIEFVPYNIRKGARWDETTFDDAEAVYCYDNVAYKPFQVLTNKIDVKTVAMRL